MFKTSIKINKLFLKYSRLVESLYKDEADYIEDLIIFDTEWEGAINAVKLLAKTHAKAQKNNQSIFYTKNHFDSNHYCYLLIGHEKDILLKIQAGINELLSLKRQYEKEYKEKMRADKAKEIVALKAKLKKLEGSK